MKDLSKEKRENLLREFRSGSHDSPMMGHIMEVLWLDTNWVATTNGGAVVLIIDQGDIAVDRSAKTVNLVGVLPELVSVGHEIGPSQLNTLLNPPMITRKVRYPCEACDETGKFDHYGETYDCKTCNEIGYTEDDEMETIPDPDVLLSINGRSLTMEKWSLLKRAIKATQPTEVRLLSHAKGNLSIIQLDKDVIIVLAHHIAWEFEAVNVVLLNIGNNLI